jgi:hypothetical protein
MERLWLPVALRTLVPRCAQPEAAARLVSN